jgi:hypothetical protein
MDLALAPVGLAGLAITAAMALHAPAERGLAEAGAVSVLLAAGRALPLVGVGLALGLSPRRPTAIGGLLLLLGYSVAIVEKERLLDALVSVPGSSARLFLVQPAACVVAGMALILPRRLRPWALPPLAAVFGGLIGFAIKLNDPGPRDLGFASGATVAVLWLVMVAGLLARRLDGRWLQILAPIAGSWLIAIGLLLGGASLVQPAPTDSAAPALAAPTTPLVPEGKLSRPRSPFGAENGP